MHAPVRNLCPPNITMGALLFYAFSKGYIRMLPNLHSVQNNPNNPRLQIYFHIQCKSNLQKMCDKTDPTNYQSFCCGVHTYSAPPSNNCCTCPQYNSKPQYKASSEPICKPPETINGLPVELAVRKEPFKGYPKRHLLNREPKTVIAEPKAPFVYVHKVPDPNTLILENSVQGPGWTSRFCLKRIHSLLVRDETAIKLEDRIWVLWMYYEKIAKDVFIYDNVDIVANIVLVLATSFIRLPYSQQLFDKVMQRLQRGIYMESSLKDVVDTKRLAYCFTVLGLAIVEGHPLAQASISSILGVWLESVMEKRQQQRFQKLPKTGRPLITQRKCPLTTRLMKPSSQLTIMVPDSVLVTALEKSLLPRTLSKYFSDGSHTEGYISILTLLKFCCDVSPVIRNRLLVVPVLDPVLLKLAIADPTNRILVTTSDFLHSYFGINADPAYHNTHSGDNETTNNNAPILEKDSFQILLTRFVQQLDHCASKSLLNTRNDTAFLICLICERVPEAGKYFEGFAWLLAAIISSAVLGTKGLEMPYLIDSTPEDLELLQYLIYMIKCIVEQGCGEDVFEECSIAAVLLRMILGPCQLTTTPDGDNVIIGGEGEKGNDLENGAWTTIQAIAKHCPLSLLTPHGAPSLLTFLKAFGDIGEGDERVLAMCMYIIRLLFTTPEEDSCFSDEVMGYFIQRDAMVIFLSILDQLSKKNFDALQETVISNSLYCCAALAYHDYYQKEEFVALEGVSILMRLMKHLLCHSAEKRHMNPAIQMALAECIGCCVAYYPQALEQFLAVEGLFRLLDILELAAGPAAPVHLTNCILQLCDYPRCVDQLLFWHRPMKSMSQRVVFGKDLDDLARSSWEEALDDGPKTGDVLQDLRPRTDQTLSSMLCSLWKEEEERFEVLRDPEGCIASITHPLMSKFARTYQKPSEEKGVSRPCLDMSLSLRPKIFLLVKRIVEVTKTEATLFDDLSIANQVVMQVIINFVDLKKSEIYLEMVEEMEIRGTNSLAPGDDESIIKLADISRNTLATVLETQRYLIRRFNEKEEINENEFYSLIKQCRLQDHLLAATEVEYLARTSNYDFLVEKRLWQKSELECAVKELDAAFTRNSRIHRVSDGQLNITTWPSRIKTLVSEPKVNREDAALENYDDNDDFIIAGDDLNLDDEHEPDEELLSGPSASTICSENVELTVMSKTGLVTSFAITETITPEPLEGGFYQVSPHRLREALRRLVSYKRKHDRWISLAEQDEDNAWKIRTKWKKDWYPLPIGEQDAMLKYV